MPYQFARAHVHDAPQHLVTFATDICSRNLITVPIFTSLGQSISKSEDSQRVSALHVHYAPQHPRSCIIKKYSLNCISVPNFALLAQSFPKVKALMHMDSARAQHVHHAPHHQMACTIELRSLNSISVPNLVSIAESFLKPKDPGQKVFRPWRVQLAPHTNGTPKDFKLVRYACDLRVWGRWCPAFDL